MSGLFRVSFRVVKWLGVAASAAIVLLAVAVGALWFKNPVFVEYPFIVLRHESPVSLFYIADFLFTYLDETTRDLEYDPSTGVANLRRAEERCADPSPGQLFECGRIAWHDGQFAKAAHLFDAQIQAKGADEVSLMWLGLSELRVGETENCLRTLLAQNSDSSGSAGPADVAAGEAGAGFRAKMSHAEMCSLPLRIPHQDGGPARAAAANFKRILDEDGGHVLHKWLLNFALMAGDRFPEGVPEEYRLPKENAFRSFFYGDRRAQVLSAYPDLKLTEIGADLQVDYSRETGKPDAGKGLAVEDFNGDGCLDIVTGGYYAPVRYLQNVCDPGHKLAFVDRSAESGLSKILGTHVITAADYDNDGAMDLFIARPWGSPRGDFVLLHNDGSGKFEDVTRRMGLLDADAEHYNQTWMSAWGDIDNDGDLDLFIAQWGFWNPNEKRSWMHVWNALDENGPSRLYRNDGNRFTDVTKEYGLDQYAKDNLFGASFGDYDSDGYVDLVLGRMYIPGVELLRNEGGKRFRKDPALDSIGWGFMTAFVDVNQDGLLDVYAGGMGPAKSVVRQVVYGDNGGNFHTGSRMWIQTEPGKWKVDTDYFSDSMPIPTMGVSFGDLDMDGALDWYLGTGNPEGWMILPNLLYMGRWDGDHPYGAQNVSMLGGVGTIQKGHGIVFADFDEDGDQDIYSTLGGYWPGDAWPNQFWRNDSTTTNGWVKIALHGCQSNRFGLGAKIRITADYEDGKKRDFFYLMDNKSGFGSAPYLAHVGVGKATRIDQVEVTWIGPGGAHTTRHQATLNSKTILVENGQSALSRQQAEASCAASQ